MYSSFLLSLVELIGNSQCAGLPKKTSSQSLPSFWGGVFWVFCCQVFLTLWSISSQDLHDSDFFGRVGWTGGVWSDILAGGFVWEKFENWKIWEFQHVKKTRKSHWFHLIFSKHHFVKKHMYMSLNRLTMCRILPTDLFLLICNFHPQMIHLSNLQKKTAFHPPLKAWRPLSRSYHKPVRRWYGSLVVMVEAHPGDSIRPRLTEWIDLDGSLDGVVIFPWNFWVFFWSWNKKLSEFYYAGFFEKGTMSFFD